MWSVIAVDVWRGVGYIMVILIAGLLAIPRDYYEAASIDGASAWSKFRHITLPLLTPVLAVVTVLNLLYGLKVFDIVFVLTRGGPGRATDTVYTMVFEDFSKGRWGLATALSTLLLRGHGRAGVRGHPGDAARRERLRCSSDRRVRGSANHLLAAVVGLLVFVPIYLVFVNSLKTRAESSSMGVGLPALPQWENYATVIEEGKLVGGLLQQPALLADGDGHLRRARGHGRVRAGAPPHPLAHASSTCC